MTSGKAIIVLAAVLGAGLPLEGNASAPAATLTPSTLTFGRENPEGPYPPQQVAVSNSGDAPLVISNITVENPDPSTGSDYTQSNNCYPFPRSLAPGESCTISVGFFPGAYGIRTGSLDVFDNAASNPQRGQLIGYAYPFRAMYTLDGWGGLHAASAVSPPMPGGGYWPGWKIAKAAALLSDASGGYTLDGFGGLHQFGAAPIALGYPYFGWDIARDVALLPGSTSHSAAGYVLDGWGGVHPFGGAPAVSTLPYWPGIDIAQRIKLLPDGTGGYVLDGWGALHPFAVGTNAVPPGVATSTWPGWNIARDFDLFSNSTAGTAAGFTLDGYGGLHPFGFVPAGPTGASSYWPGFDIAKSIRLSPTSTTATPFGWMMDGSGGFHSINGGQDIPGGAYWPGWSIAGELVVVR